MKIGVPSEVKVHEGRVAMTSAGVRELTSRGHEVLIQSGAGRGSGISNERYAAAGATLLDSAEAVWKAAEMIVKVKEPWLKSTT